MKLLMNTAVALLVAIAVPSVCRAQDVDAAATSVDAAQERYAALLADFEHSREQFVTLAANIEAAKTTPPATPFDVLELQRSLREAHSLAHLLTSMEDDLRAAADERDLASSRLADEAAAELASLEAQVAGNPALAPTLRPRIDALVALVERSQAPLPPFEPVPIDAIAADLPDSSDEWYAAADELADAAARLERQLDEVNERLDQAAARERLERRVSGIAFEESMFETDRGRLFESPRTTARSTATSGEGGFVADESRDNGETGDAEAAGAEDLGVGGDALPPDGDMEGAQPDSTDHPVDDNTDPIEVVVPLGDPTTITAEGVASPEQTQLDEPADVGRNDSGRGRSSRDLRARQATIESELEAVRAEQQRIIERARALQAEGL